MRPIPSILLVDDEPLTLEVLVDLFQTLQVPRIRSSSNAQEALEILQSESFSLIIADYHLHGKSGVNFLEDLRQRGDQTPLIILSGRPDTDGVVRASKLPNTEFLSKPFQITELSKTIDNLLSIPSRPI